MKRKLLVGGGLFALGFGVSSWMSHELDKEAVASVRSSVKLMKMTEERLKHGIEQVKRAEAHADESNKTAILLGDALKNRDEILLDKEHIIVSQYNRLVQLEEDCRVLAITLERANEGLVALGGEVVVVDRPEYPEDLMKGSEPHQEILDET